LSQSSLKQEKNVQMVRLHYGLWDGEEYTLQKIGEYFGLTRERVRQRIRETLNLLKSRLNSAGITEI